MKRIITFAVAALFVATAAFAGTKAVKRTVVYKSSIHCAHCVHKIEETVALSKGVKDLKTDLEAKTITVVFDEAKTDTATIAKAIRKVGFTASVVDFK